MFKHAAALAITLFSVATSVKGHGYVQEVTLGSTKYTGYLPYSDPYVHAHTPLYSLF
jgi:hypothetical protein